MAEAAGGQAFAGDLKEVAAAVLGAYRHFGRARNDAEFAGDAETALGLMLFALGGNDLGVQKLDHIRLLPLGDIGLQDQHRAAQHTHLGCGKADAVGV